MAKTPVRDEIRRQLDALPATSSLLLGFSGGMDSTVLLHALANDPLIRERGLRALHVDHGLHADSPKWARQCLVIAAELNVPIVSVRVDVKADDRGLEDAAREARHAALAQHMHRGETVVLAHHRDDQAETILLKLLRGAGPEGLGGMRGLRAWHAGLLWRPLLNLPRDILRAYAIEQGLRFIDDPSNADTALRRNFLRHEILPALQQRWPDASAALAHSATWARAAADFIGDQVAMAFAEVRGVDSSTLHWRPWLELPDALRDPVLRLWLRESALDEPANYHVTELERQLREAGEDRSPCVSWVGAELRRYRDLLYAMPTSPVVPAEWQLDWDGSPITLPDGGRLALQSCDAIHLDPPRSLHVPQLKIGYRRGGERMKPAASAHTRELRVLLQESGIPPWQRTHLPLLFADDELIAIADLYVSERGRDVFAQLRAELRWWPAASRTIDSAAKLR